MSPRLQKIFKAYMKAYAMYEMDGGHGMGREMERRLGMKQPGVAYWMKKLRTLKLASPSNKPTKKAMEIYDKIKK